MGKYITIQLPEEFVEGFIDPILNMAKLGYSSRAEVVKDGVKMLYDKYIGWNVQEP